MVIETSEEIMEELDLTVYASDFNKNEELDLPMRLDEVNEYLCAKEPIYNDSRMQLYPIKYEDIWDMYNKAKAAFWVAEEVSLTDDVTDWEKLDDEELISKVADKISKQNCIGWFQGRMEFGPRALGSRSILADPRSEKMQSTLNLKIKFRDLIMNQRRLLAFLHCLSISE